MRMVSWVRAPCETRGASRHRTGAGTSLSPR